MKKKTIVLMLALTLIAGAFIGGTIAWLTAETETVENVFTTSDIEIKLEETEEDFKMVPGHTIKKDPVVTVKDGSEPAWLFVKLEKSDNFDDFMKYEVAEGWEPLKDDDNNDVPGVYYRKVKGDDIGKGFSVLYDDQVKVKENLTKEDMEVAYNNKPTLTVTAYATQLYKEAGIEFNASEAWANVANPKGTTTP